MCLFMSILQFILQEKQIKCLIEQIKLSTTLGQLTFVSIFCMYCETVLMKCPHTYPAKFICWILTCIYCVVSFSCHASCSFCGASCSSSYVCVLKLWYKNNKIQVNETILFWQCTRRTKYALNQSLHQPGLNLFFSLMNVWPLSLLFLLLLPSILKNLIIFASSLYAQRLNWKYA